MYIQGLIFYKRIFSYPIILCRHDMNVKLKSLGIRDKLPSSDHLPMFANLLFDNYTPDLNTCSTARDKVTFNWCKAFDYNILTMTMTMTMTMTIKIVYFDTR